MKKLNDVAAWLYEWSGVLWVSACFGAVVGITAAYAFNFLVALLTG